MRLEAWRLVLALGLLAPLSAAKPAPEVVREEAYNYRILGPLPRGWKREATSLVFTYRVDGIPLAFVHFVRERVSGKVDVAAELDRRREHYRFPGTPKKTVGTIAPTRWGERAAQRYLLEARINGVDCRREVRAVFDRGIWYECIETLHGEPDKRTLAGLACFRGGFMLLARALPKKELADPAARTMTDAVYGYRLEKPKGYLVEEARPGADPGCRLVLVLRGPKQGQLLSVRLFEYGLRKQYSARNWLSLFFDSFARQHAGAKHTEAQAPRPEGCVQAAGARFVGRSDKREVVATLYLWQTKSGRVFALRILSHGGAAETHAASLKKLVDSFRFTGAER